MDTTKDFKWLFCIKGVKTTHFLDINNSTGIVGIGTTNPKALLHVRGKWNNSNKWTYGSDGTRLILWPGTADAVPYSFGIAGSTLWY
jgi:hypothetical protein